MDILQKRSISQMGHPGGNIFGEESTRETAVHEESTENLNLIRKEKTENLNLVQRSTLDLIFEHF